MPSKSVHFNLDYIRDASSVINPKIGYQPGPFPKYQSFSFQCLCTVKEDEIREGIHNKTKKL